GGGKFSTPTTLGTVGQAHTLAYADFDKNGYLDIAASGYSSSQVLVVQTASGFIPLSTSNLASGGGWARGLTVGDFNRDGNTDLVVTNVNFNNAIIFYGPAFFSSRTLSTGSYPIGAIAGDFNGDGRTDFTTSNYVGQSLSFFLQQTDGSFIRSDVSLIGRPSDFPKVADVDGDGLDEVIVGQSESYQGVAVVTLPSSGIAAVEYYATASNVQDVFINDVNSDGKPDFGAVVAGSIVQYQNLNLGAPTYVITSSAPSVNEGSNVTFTIDTKNVEWGNTISYTLTGISQSDLASGSLSGTATVNQNGVGGRATVIVNLASDQTTEGAEALRLVVGSTTSSAVTINDTSPDPNPPTYSITANQATVNEGSTATFTVSTTNVP
ncbi:MAG: VCBS repeat-containing protein, partial [Betaproteobacteria bacterium]|nr:VCBS repeat-containing protein [Betaproteobacteria bacterium]